MNKKEYLSGISLDDLAAALTDPKKRFEFPIKPIEFDLSPASKTTIILIGSAIAIGLFINASKK